MGNSFNSSNDYRIEISGWGLDNSFFVERTDLIWTPGGEKWLQLRRALPEGAIVFLRLLSVETLAGSIPVAYQVRGIGPMDRNGLCQMRLGQLHPRSKESPAVKNASNDSEDLPRVCDTHEVEVELQHEEVLQ